MEEKEVKEVYKILANYRNKLFLTDDLIQDVVMKVVKNYDEGKYNAEKSSLATWVYNIAKNEKITQDRKENGSKFEKEKQRLFLRIDVDVFESSLATENNDYDNEIQLEKEIVINKSIEQLSVKEKDVIIKYYYEDYSIKQISEELSITIGNVKSILFRARNKIKVFLQKD
jgi:RNA polymerase sigma-70 factor (ECF subfamily)